MDEIGRESAVMHSYEEQGLVFRNSVLIESLILIISVYASYSVNKKYTRIFIFIYLFYIMISGDIFNHCLA